jgi:hypothetical protein
LKRDIEAAENSIIDVNFKDEPQVFPKGDRSFWHQCVYNDPPDKDCKACEAEAKEAKRLEREKLAEDEANRNAPYEIRSSQSG